MQITDLSSSSSYIGVLGTSSTGSCVANQIAQDASVHVARVTSDRSDSFTGLANIQIYYYTNVEIGNEPYWKPEGVRQDGKTYLPHSLLVWA